MDYLSGYHGGILLISHDLPLLDTAITSILELDGARLEAYRGDYSGLFWLRTRPRPRAAGAGGTAPPGRGDRAP